MVGEKRNSFSYTTAGLHSKKGPVIQTPFSGHFAINPLKPDTVRFVKGTLHYTDAAKYHNVEEQRMKFASANRGKNAISKIAKEKCDRSKLAGRAYTACYLGALRTAGRERFGRGSLVASAQY